MRTDGWTDMSKLTVAFRIFVKAPEIMINRIIWLGQLNISWQRSVHNAVGSLI
jgi:hypothetical protein